MRTWSVIIVGALAALLTGFPKPAEAAEATATTAGELVVEPPTLISLGFEWRIEGDANRNARAELFLEADGSMHNVRIFRNRCFNAAVGAMSPQPVFGGPVYFMRNVVYNSPFGPLKVHADPAGVLIYNNTYIGEVAQLTPASNIHFRNNLIIGQGQRPQVFAVDTRTRYSTSDYNGFRPNLGAEPDFRWSAPPDGEQTLYGAPLPPRYFDDFDDYVAATGQDANSVLLDYDAFVRAAPPDTSDPTRLYRPSDVDLRLRDGSAAIDAGIHLPGVTDDYTGEAPDLGAYERGLPPPHYGPRPNP